jgi:hypothetical protein
VCPQIYFRQDPSHGTPLFTECDKGHRGTFSLFFYSKTSFIFVNRKYSKDWPGLWPFPSTESFENWEVRLIIAGTSGFKLVFCY